MNSLEIVFHQDGLLRVILDGGPSRVFSLGDAKLLEEDLEILKVFKLVFVGYAREIFYLPEDIQANFFLPDILN